MPNTIPTTIKGATGIFAKRLQVLVRLSRSGQLQWSTAEHLPEPRRNRRYAVHVQLQRRSLLSHELLFIVKQEPPRTFAHRQAMILANFNSDSKRPASPT